MADSATARGPKIRFGIDIGGVMSRHHHQGGIEEPWTSCTPGFWPFLVLFLAHFGPHSVFVISRTNTASWETSHGKPSWVIRFLTDIGLFRMGIPKSQVALVKDRRGKDGKGPAAEKFQLTHFVDDSPQVCTFKFT